MRNPKKADKTEEKGGAALQALRTFQDQMKGIGKESEITSDEAVAEWITQSRREEGLREVELLEAVGRGEEK
ncbi:MAG: hypothetical protein II730_07160 [Bacteroidales bacterium]|nr:hypothetical protein [Bacteroidales bacterium]